MKKYISVVWLLNCVIAVTLLHFCGKSVPVTHFLNRKIHFLYNWLICFRMVTDCDYLEKKMPMVDMSLLKVGLMS